MHSDDLKPETKEFLESLDEEDIHRIKNALKVYTTVETLASWLKVLLFGFLATAVLLSQFGDAVKKLVLWFR